MLKVESQGEKLVISEKLVTSGRKCGGGKRHGRMRREICVQDEKMVQG